MLRGKRKERKKLQQRKYESLSATVTVLSQEISIIRNAAELVDTNLNTYLENGKWFVFKLGLNWLFIVDIYSLNLVN